VEVFQPYDRVGVSVVLDHIRRRTKTCWEWRLPDPFVNACRSQASGLGLRRASRTLGCQPWLSGSLSL
jgi:hypothetical protein